MATALTIIITGCGGSSSSSHRSAANTIPTAPARGVAILQEPYRKPASPGPHPGAKVKHLVIKDVIRGTGAELQAGDTGIFDFISTDWVTGRPVESSWKRKRQFETRIEHGVVIDGWWQGIPGMRVGGERRLIIPPELGFTQGMNPEVQNSTLYYDVVLLGVKPLEPPGMTPGGGQSAGGVPPPSTVGTPSG
jgi:FKBP-type peptidyl-prolyl isomerase-like protein